MVLPLPNLPGPDMMLQSISGHVPGGLADIPFDRVQAVAAVRNLRCPDVLQAGSRFCTRTGSSAPIGISNG
ncbi:hypothetical protein HMSSN036_37170 [Paenibacillus macerans]|nr:hypothetical protein HMSSN036_37170 [Paenibacillus macerans]